MVFGFSWVENAGLRWELNGKQPRSAPNLLIIAVLQRKKGVVPSTTPAEGMGSEAGCVAAVWVPAAGCAEGDALLATLQVKCRCWLKFSSKSGVKPRC